MIANASPSRTGLPTGEAAAWRCGEGDYFLHVAVATHSQGGAPCPSCCVQSQFTLVKDNSSATPICRFPVQCREIVAAMSLLPSTSRSAIRESPVLCAFRRYPPRYVARRLAPPARVLPLCTSEDSR